MRWTYALGLWALAASTIGCAQEGESSPSQPQPLNQSSPDATVSPTALVDAALPDSLAESCDLGGMHVVMHDGNEVEHFAQSVAHSWVLLLGRMTLGDERDYAYSSSDGGTETGRTRSVALEGLRVVGKSYDGAHVRFVVEETRRYRPSYGSKVFAATPCGRAQGAKPEGYLSDRLAFFEGQPVGVLAEHDANEGVWWVRGVAPQVGEGLQAARRVISLAEIENYVPPPPPPAQNPDVPDQDRGLPPPPEDSSGAPARV